MSELRTRSTAGLTLIELMVTLALFAFLILIGLPLTRGWVQSAHQRDALGMMTEGLGRAKALAMRNPQGFTSQAVPVAVACLVVGKVSVVAAGTSGVDCSQASDWNAQLPSDASVVQTQGGTTFQCAAYNERGIALAVSVGSLTCTPSSTSSFTPSSLNINDGELNAITVSLP
jgi:type IV pilus assembly protein PilA